MVNWLQKGKISDLDFMHGFTEPSLAIYVMTINGLSSKIGYSTNPGLRCGGLQTGSVDEITIFWAARLPAAQARKLEKMCHAALKKVGRHLRGEWFRIHPSVATDVIKRLAEEAKFDLVPDLFFGY